MLKKSVRLLAAAMVMASILGACAGKTVQDIPQDTDAPASAVDMQMKSTVEPADSTEAPSAEPAGGLIIETGEMIPATEEGLWKAALADIGRFAGSYAYGRSDYGRKNEVGDHFTVRGYLVAGLQVSETRSGGPGYSLELLICDNDVPIAAYDVSVMWKEGDKAYENLYEQLYFPHWLWERELEMFEKYASESGYPVACLEIDVTILSDLMDEKSDENGGYYADNALRSLFTDLTYRFLKGSTGETGNWNGQIYLTRMPEEASEYDTEFWICTEGQEAVKLSGEWRGNSQSGNTLWYSFSDQAEEAFTEETGPAAYAQYAVSMEYTVLDGEWKETAEPSGYLSGEEPDEAGRIYLSEEKSLNVMLSYLLGTAGEEFWEADSEESERSFSFRGEVKDRREDRSTPWFSSWEEIALYQLESVKTEAGESETDSKVVYWKGNHLGYGELEDYFDFRENRYHLSSEGMYRAAYLDAEISMAVGKENAKFDEISGKARRVAWRDVIIREFAAFLETGASEGAWSVEIYMIEQPTDENRNNCRFWVLTEGQELIQLQGRYESWKGRYIFSEITGEEMTLDEIREEALMKYVVDLRYGME